MKSKTEAIVLFDGVCNLCNNAVQFILRHDKTQKFKFASLQSDVAIQLLQKHSKHEITPESIVLLINGTIYYQSGAALRIAKELNFPVSLLYVFMLIPAFIRDSIYKWIAKNRYRWFGKRETCMIPSSELSSRFL